MAGVQGQEGMLHMRPLGGVQLVRHESISDRSFFSESRLPPQKWTMLFHCWA